MQQLPIFVNLAGRKVVLLGEGPAADAKRRLIERAGGICVAENTGDAKLAFIAMEEDADALAAAKRLRKGGLLVNVVDRPEHCDFTTPAIVDRDPVLIAVGTGGASAGLAKAVRQHIEALLPASLGQLARQLFKARSEIKRRWPESNDRRRAIDTALAGGGALDITADHRAQDVPGWLDNPQEEAASGLHIIDLASNDPEDLTLRAARMLGEADHIYHEADVPADILNRARADAERHIGGPPETLPSGLILHLRLHAST